MADIELVVDESARGRDEESVFARGENDELIRREKATREQFATTVTVRIDGYAVTIPQAVPTTDARGNPLRAADGGLIPRNSTIYDAAMKLARDGDWDDAQLAERIPVLCHQPHLHPVGMCRMCVVQIQQIKRGTARTERKLLPACQHMVAENMVVTTRAGWDGYDPGEKSRLVTEARAKAGEEFDKAWATKPGDPAARESSRAAALDAAESKAGEGVEKFAANIRKSTALVAELLVADHLKPELSPVKRYEDELSAVARVVGVESARPRLQLPAGAESRNAAPGERSRRVSLPVTAAVVQPERLPGRADRKDWVEWNHLIDEELPYSSRTVVVDHDRCILCDRCVRSCADVRPFKVIGHTGKGYETRVSFDLDSLMGESSCVQCGECMNSCPTGALSLRRRVQPRAWEDSPTAVAQNPNTPFPDGSGFLDADEMQQVRLDYVSPSRGPQEVFPFRAVPYSYLKWNEGAVRRWDVPAGESRVLCREGEYASTAFLTDGSGEFHIYARGDLAAPVKSPGLLNRLFGGKPDPAAGLGKLVRVAPGHELIQGEMSCLTHRPRTASVVAVGPAAVYEVTRNLLDVMQRSAAIRSDIEEVYTARAVQACVSRGRMFAPLPDSEKSAVARYLQSSGKLELRRLEAGQTLVAEGDLAGDESHVYIVRLGTLRVFSGPVGREKDLRLLTSGDSFGEVSVLKPGRTPRTASVATLDPAEVVLVPKATFLAMCDQFPALRAELESEANTCVKPKPPPEMLGEFVRQGLYQGQKLLALDLVNCTRCDECTRACADSHDGHARLLREGLRFGDFLVATSCRSCLKPYCMDGCPVDAIHRRGNHLEVKIEDHCIGCGLCEKNCPYGAIHMVGRGSPNYSALDHAGGDPTKTAARRAVNCDLCNGGEPFCVQACPHEAAFRFTGAGLLEVVEARRNGG